MVSAIIDQCLAQNIFLLFLLVVCDEGCMLIEFFIKSISSTFIGY